MHTRVTHISLSESKRGPSRVPAQFTVPARAGRQWIPEDKAAEKYLREGQYDLVIGNPPGNEEYSGTNRDEVARRWAEQFGHEDGGLMDHHCFLRRALELANADGGRVCMLVPEGLLARDNRGMPSLRTELLRDCELMAVISLPQVFRNNNARMAIIYLVRTHSPNRRRRVLMASIERTWTDESGTEQNVDVFGELETIVDRFLEEL
jgi:type I restriction-modification system DNA methylase subunit